MCIRDSANTPQPARRSIASEKTPSDEGFEADDSGESSLLIALSTQLALDSPTSDGSDDSNTLELSPEESQI